MRYPHIPPVIHRLRVRPDQPADGPPAIEAERPRVNGRRSKRPHNDMSVAVVRRLIETTTLTYSEISARTGVGRASICRWARDQGWQRPLSAPRATDTVPTQRAGRKLKLRTLAEKLLALTERHVRELETAPVIDADALMAALQLLKMARLEAQGRRRRGARCGFTVGRTETAREWMSRQDAMRAALRELDRGGVDLDRAPQEAIDLVVEANAPLEDETALKPPRKRRGRRKTRNEEHAWLLEKE